MKIFFKNLFFVCAVSCVLFCSSVTAKADVVSYKQLITYLEDTKGYKLDDYVCVIRKSYANIKEGLSGNYCVVSSPTPLLMGYRDKSVTDSFIMSSEHYGTVTSNTSYYTIETGSTVDVTFTYYNIGEDFSSCSKSSYSISAGNCVSLFGGELLYSNYDIELPIFEKVDGSWTVTDGDGVFFYTPILPTAKVVELPEIMEVQTREITIIAVGLLALLIGCLTLPKILSIFL